MNSSNRETWGSRWGFILAAAGSAVGLGNIWRFPYVAGENGGGIFVLIYLVCIALVGVPIMMAEIMIGRAAQKQPIEAFHELEGKQTPWAAVGWMGVICGFVILSYYIVVAGWTMDYTLKAMANFSQPIHETAHAEALRYRASGDVSEMREMLAAKRADTLSRSDVGRLLAKARPSSSRNYDRMQATLDGVEDRALAEVRLMEEPAMQRAMGEMVPLMTQIDAVRAAFLQEARAYYERLDDKVVRDQAVPERRRQAIYAEVESAFGALASDGWTCTFWALLFMLVCVLIVGNGIGSGIERACKVLMPTLFILILGMVVYGAFRDGFGEAVAFVFRPDIYRLKPSGVLEALGHAFFTLSLGMGAMLTYGSYQRRKEGLTKECVIIAGLDTSVALLACLMIFPVVFSFGQQPSAGPGLIFMSMPVAFAEIGPGGMLLSVAFFALVTLAALTSAISLLEVVSSYFIDAHGWSRKKAAWMLGGCIFVFGIPSAFSFDDSFVMAGWQSSFGRSFFDTMDYLASNWLLPLGGLFIAIYVGWVMPRRIRDAELVGCPVIAGRGWLFLIRFVAPLLVVLVLLEKSGLLEADELLYNLLH